tara:strand:- start:6467 stop:6697 length:231 start_codon:yes stop_codon:yes gene_type:complete
MRSGAIILAISALALSACEKDFDEKYQDNLEKLNEEARQIESGVSQQLAEGREADKIMESADEKEPIAEPDNEVAQ